MLLDRESENKRQDLLLATVDSVTNDGLTMILDGESEATQKKYKYLTSAYSDPSVGDRVVVMRMSGTYVVLGRIGRSSQGSDEKVSKSGDTMTGALIMKGADINLRSTSNTIGTVPSTSVSDRRVYFRDKLNTIFGKLQSVFLNDGRVGMQLGAQRTVDGNLVENNVSLYIDANGNRSVTFTQIAAWRAALGLGTSGALPITVGQGGTGLTASPSMLVNLASATAANVMTASPRPGVTGKLPVGNGGTGLDASPSMLVNLASASAANIFAASPRPGVTGKLPVGNGGTGLDASPSMLVNLGSTSAANILAASPRPGVTGTLPVGNGGTGQTATSSIGTLAQIMTVSSGITVVDQSFLQWGKVAQIFLQFYSSSSYSVDAYGNLTTAVANIGTLVSGKRPGCTTALTSAHNGSMRPFGRILSSGNPGAIQLLGFEGTGAARTVPANTVITFCGTYILP